MKNYRVWITVSVGTTTYRYDQDVGEIEATLDLPAPLVPALELGPLFTVLVKEAIGRHALKLLEQEAAKESADEP